MRERQIPVMPPSLASGFRKLKSDGTGQCLYFGRYCSQTPRKFACFVLPAWDQILAKINEGDVCLRLLSIFIARESQRLRWSHLAKSLGQAANFEVQLTTTTQQQQQQQQQHNFAFYAASACTWELVLGEAISLKCNLVIVLVLGSCGTLAL